MSTHCRTILLSAVETGLFVVQGGGGKRWFYFRSHPNARPSNGAHDPLVQGGKTPFGGRRSAAQHVLFFSCKSIYTTAAALPPLPPPPTKTDRLRNGCFSHLAIEITNNYYLASGESYSIRTTDCLSICQCPSAYRNISKNYYSYSNSVFTYPIAIR